MPTDAPRDAVGGKRIILPQSVSPVGSGLDPQTSLEHHFNSDLDLHPAAQHHTLGKGPMQAAPGNHTHPGSTGVTGVFAGVNYLGSNSTTADTASAANNADFSTLTAFDSYGSGVNWDVSGTHLRLLTPGLVTVQVSVIYSLTVGAPAANSDMTISMADAFSARSSLQNTEPFESIGTGLTHLIVKTVTWSFNNAASTANQLAIWFSTNCGGTLNSRFEVRLAMVC